MLSVPNNDKVKCMAKQPFLSVVVPSYNEMKNMNRGVLEDILVYLQSQQYEWELVFSDDGSTDGTTDKLKKFARQNTKIKVVANDHAGKGPTVSAGMLAATGEYRLFTDFDQSTPLSEVEKLWPFVQKGNDIIIGSRAVQGAKRDKEPWYRHLMGKVFNLVVQMFAVPGIHDTQCGFKMFSAAATEDLFPRLKVYATKKRQDAFTGAFDVELLYLARKQKYSIAEVPVLWQHNETDRVSPVKDSLRMFRDILRIRWAAISGQYHEK